jgi:uncharacterized LabA/DUF88 family protein
MNSRPPRHTPSRAGPAVHRPAPTAAPIPVAAPLNFAPNAALLIDFDNVTMGIRSDLQTELRTLLASDIIKGKVQLRRAYADWRRYPQYVAPLAESSIDMIMAPAYGSSKKNATDIRLAIDALELVFTRPEIGTYILLSGDSDFSTLVIKLKEYGKYVIGVGIRESSSDLLVMNCDEYYSYNALAGLVRSGGEEESNTAARRDPWELVSEAIARMVRNGDVMRADRLKQVMQDIDSTFDEKNLGMSKFSRFVQEAAQRGLLSLSKMDNGQLEVGPPRPSDVGGAGAATPALSAGPSAASEDRVAAPAARDSSPQTERGEERGRRGRRGGRGRGRDRDREVRTAPESGPANAAADAFEASPVDASAVAEPVVAVPEVAASDIAHVSVTPDIGASGDRLTRDEAFDLVRRAVAALARGEETIRASDLRRKAFEMLGRDSESLSERNFARILRDAHDLDVIDLRRRGDDFEVAPAAIAEPVAHQLNAAAAAHAVPVTPPATSPTGATSTAIRRGLGVRGVRRGGAHVRPGAPPAELLAVGIVDVGTPSSTLRAPEPEGLTLDQAVELRRPVDLVAPETAAQAASAEEEAPAPARRGGTTRRGRARPKRSSTSASAEAGTKTKRGRTRAAKSTDG